MSCRNNNKVDVSDSVVRLASHMRRANLFQLSLHSRRHSPKYQALAQEM